MKHRTVVVIGVLEIAAIAATAGLVLWATLSPAAAQGGPTPVVMAWPTATVERTTVPPPRRVTIAAVGDLMAHSPQLAAAKTGATYDFAPAFAAVASEIGDADLAIGNLETVLGGADRGYTGYPSFNSPDAYASALAATGFDVLTTANNHSLDRGAAGVKRTLDVLDRLNIEHTGTARSKKEAESILLADAAGVKVAVLAYTYGMNGLTPPADEPWLVNTLSQARMEAAIAKADELGADIIIVSVHDGVEYERTARSDDAALTRALIDAGADIVLGSHPHVIQPMTAYEVARSDGTTETAFIIHSLGNFFSAQRPRYRDAGVIVNLTFEQSRVDGRTSLVAVEYVPTWVDSTGPAGAGYRVLPIAAALQDPDRAVSASDVDRMRQAWRDTTEHLGGAPSAERPMRHVFWAAAPAALPAPDRIALADP